MNLFGYQGWYRNPEASLEGFDGKMLTFVSIVAMQLSIDDRVSRVEIQANPKPLNPKTLKLGQKRHGKRDERP